MMQKVLEFSRNNQTYRIYVTYKSQRNIYFRYKKEAFYVSAPYLTSSNKIMKGIDKYFDKLISQSKKQTTHYSFKEDYLFLLGNKISLVELKIQDKQDLREFLYQKAYEVLEQEVRKYELIMDIQKPYKITVKETTRQYGSNSKRTHSLSFQLSLIHYSLDIIDTLVVHELAHEFERNHQQSFYDIVYKYCPNYKALQKKLKKGIHS